MTGTHYYSFSYSLPSDLPSTVKEAHGEIRYSITLIFDRPFKLGLKYPFDFTVVRPLNLNGFLKIPVKQEVTKNYFWMTCGRKPIVMTADLPRSGFLVGDKVTISINLHNSTRIKIQKLEVNLIKFGEYRSQRPRKSTKLVEHCEYMEIVEIPNDGSNPPEISMTIPQCTPSSEIDQVGIIKISYKIQIKAKVSPRKIKASSSIL